MPRRKWTEEEENRIEFTMPSDFELSNTAAGETEKNYPFRQPERTLGEKLLEVEILNRRALGGCGMHAGLSRRVQARHGVIPPNAPWRIRFVARAT
jgi:hypothetical protein